MVDTVKISELPASQTINNVSGTLEYKATGDIKLTPGSGLIKLNGTLVTISEASNTAGTVVQLGNSTTTATTTPLTIDMGGSYSSVAGANPKLKIYDDGTFVYGIGVSVGAMNYIAPLAGNVHNFYCNGTNGFMVSSTTITAPTSVTTPSIITPAATDLNINATTTFVRFNSNNLTGIGTAIGTALDFPTLINTNVVGATNLTVGSVVGNVRFTPGNNQVDFVSSAVLNATITDTSNNVAANSLKTATGVVSVAAATAPSTGQVLTATSSTTATWQANSSLAWTALTTTTVSAAVNNGYIATGGALQTFTIPATFAVGDIIEVAAFGAGGFRIAQNASQNIRFGNTVTTTGTGGRLDSTLQGDTLRMIGAVANTSLMVLSAVGNITVT